MAKAKTKTNTKKKPSSAKPNGAAKQAAKSGDLNGPDQLLAALPALDQAHRAAFREAFDDASCIALGAQTKSDAVRSVALSWAADAASAVQSPLADDIDYGAERLTWLVEQIVELDVARGTRAGKGTVQSTVRTTRDVAIAKAKPVHTRLLAQLTDAAPNAPELEAAGSKDDLAGALDTLAALGERILGSSAPGDKVRAKAAKLTAERVADAKKAARDIRDAGEAVALGGRGSAKDTPEVNLVEGRVLRELLVLRDAFEAARDRGVPVPALIPTPPVARVLGHDRRAKKPAEPADPAKPPAPPA